MINCINNQLPLTSAEQISDMPKREKKNSVRRSPGCDNDSSRYKTTNNRQSIRFTIVRDWTTDTTQCIMDRTVMGKRHMSRCWSSRRRIIAEVNATSTCRFMTTGEFQRRTMTMMNSKKDLQRSIRQNHRKRNVSCRSTLCRSRIRRTPRRKMISIVTSNTATNKK